MTPLEYLEKNPNISKTDFQNAFPNENQAKLESIYNGFQNTKDLDCEDVKVLQRPLYLNNY